MATWCCLQARARSKGRSSRIGRCHSMIARRPARLCARWERAHDPAAAEAGYNNEIGLPLTLARIEPETQVVVTEMGMRGSGQIRALAEIARPDVAVVTAIAPVHLELLGTIENIARAKAELLEALPA